MNNVQVVHIFIKISINKKYVSQAEQVSEAIAKQYMSPTSL